MSSPSPFEIASKISKNFGEGYREHKEGRAIEDILQQAQSGGDPLQKGELLSQLISRVSQDKQKSVLALLESQKKEQKSQNNLQNQRNFAKNYGLPEGFEYLPDSSKAALIKSINAPPPGGTTAQPTPPEIGMKISEIIESNPDASAEDIALSMDKEGIPRIFSNPYIETRRRQDEAKSKSDLSKSERKSARDEKLIEKVDEARQLIPVKKGSSAVMRNAILNDDLGFFSLNNLAEKVPGMDWALSGWGATFKGAQKNHLVATLSQITGQKNQWIERQISESYAKIGRPKDSNLAAMVFTEFEANALEKWGQIVDKLDEKGNIAPGKLGKAASEEMTKWYEKEIKNINKTINDIASGKLTSEYYFKPEGKVLMYAPDGGVLYVDDDDEQIQYYESLGATKG